jgi:hypothetical protein
LCGRIRAINYDSLNVSILYAHWYDENNKEISSTKIISNRTLIGTDVGWKNDVAVLSPPPNSKKIKIYVSTSNNSKVKTDISYIGLYKLTLNTGNSNFNNVISEIAKPHFNRRYKRNSPPISSNTWDKNVNYIKGDIIYKDSSAMVSGEEYEWLCTESGVWDVQNPKFIAINSSKLSTKNEYDFGVIETKMKSQTIDIPMLGIKFESIVVGSFSKALNGCKIITEVKYLDKVSIYIENNTALSQTIGKGFITLKEI